MCDDIESLHFETENDSLHIPDEPQAPRDDGASPEHVTNGMQHGEAAPGVIQAIRVA